MKSKKIVVPTPRDDYNRARRKNRRWKRPRASPKLYAQFDTTQHSEPSFGPTLIFKRRGRSSYTVPAVKVPLYWFDQVMVNKGWIIPIPPDHFIVDGRRFKVLAQHWRDVRFGYTRWLVYEELAGEP